MSGMWTSQLMLTSSSDASLVDLTFSTCRRVLFQVELTYGRFMYASLCVGCLNGIDSDRHLYV